eukprot:9073546-Karenia_brevis.AAC.1
MHWHSEICAYPAAGSHQYAGRSTHAGGASASSCTEDECGRRRPCVGKAGCVVAQGRPAHGPVGCEAIRPRLLCRTEATTACQA